MRIRKLAACIASTLLIASPSAFSAKPVPGGTQVVKFRTIAATASGSACDNSSCTSFQYIQYDDQDGVVQGDLYAQIFYFNGSPFQAFRCTGPTFANIMAVNEKTWKATIKATISASDGNCSFAFIPAPFTFDLTGTPDGLYHDSFGGNGTVTSETDLTKYKFQNDQISEGFVGTNGFFTGNFHDGFVLFQRRTNLEKTK